MASPWALERFNGLAGSMTRLIPQIVGAAWEKTFTRRPAAAAAADEDPGRRRPALRHAVLISGNSNQALLDVRWGEPAITDDRPYGSFR